MPIPRDCGAHMAFPRFVMRNHGVAVQSYIRDKCAAEGKREFLTGTKKVGYVLLDGCSDRPVPSLNYSTPLEVANTPNLDAIARRGKRGRGITGGRGISPECAIAVL